MMRWILIGSLLKRAAQVLATCLMVLVLANGVVEMADLVQNWPERLSQFVDELLSHPKDFGYRRGIGLGR
jgi:hypothetical protein